MLRFHFRRYRLAFRAPVNTAHGPWREREGVIVRLTRPSGECGYGEAAPIPWFGTETVEEVAAACGALGQDAAVEEAALEEAISRWPCLRQAVDAALRDLTDTPAAVATGPGYLGVAALLPAGRTAPARLRPMVEAGFRVFKWKVGVGDIADELTILDEICAGLPDGAKLRLDANGAWDRRQAERWLERGAERPVEFFEQPCFAGAGATRRAQDRADDLLRGLAADFPTPIALDESLVSEGDVARWLADGWRGVFVIKPSLLADPGAVLARLAAAKAEVVFSAALETAIGARAALRHAFAWSGAPRALGFGVWPLFADGRFDGPPTAPFLRREDVERIDPEALWNALL